MYSDKENVNILTALLKAWRVAHVVVCPGSRNSPLVHNFNECPEFTCWPVTDERSAGFFALGLSQASDTPVAVCVTSGSALLNLSPAVAEGTYQHRGLIVISADRPMAWIDQQDGQTLPQPNAFGSLVRKCVSLPEIHTAEDRWLCNRLINEALAVRQGVGHPSVHINVPISEPLFHYSVPLLEQQRMISFSRPSTTLENLLACDLVTDFLNARKPMIVLGQWDARIEDEASIETLKQHAAVLYEALGHPLGGVNFDEALASMNEGDYLPDFLIYCGGTLVSKRLKQFLRQEIEQVWEISEDGELHDTFMCAKAVFVGDPHAVLNHLAEAVRQTPPARIPPHNGKRDSFAFVNRWRKVLEAQRLRSIRFSPAFSQMAVVRLFEQNVPSDAIVHYANSSSVRLANIYARHYVYCNRGVNGIDGCVSTAAGFSCATDKLTFVVVGDLAFFYDSNALWNQNLGGNLRILLLNNGRGGIFNLLKGLEQSPARDRLVAAEHYTSAEGVCRAHHVEYHAARSLEELEAQLPMLMRKVPTVPSGGRPMLLEVFTNADEDARMFDEYLHGRY